MTFRPHLLCWLRGHDWRGWRYGYPSSGSVYLYNHCERCGKRVRHAIVEENEVPPGTVREQREQSVPFGEPPETENTPTCHICGGPPDDHDDAGRCPGVEHYEG